MTDKSKKENQNSRIDEKKRFNYIGFEVFPGEPKDLFKSDAEKKKYVDKVQAKRQGHDALREDCTLLEERVSGFDRIVLTIAAVVVVASLFLPWYSAYNEIVEEAVVKENPVVMAASDSLDLSAASDSAGAMVDSAALIMAEQTSETAPSGTDTSVMAATGTNTEGATGALGESQPSSSSEEVISGFTGRRKSIHKEYDHLTGLGVFASFGSIGSTVFSSGFVLIISGILMLVYQLLCLALPAYTIYGMYGVKGDADQKALALKKIVRYNWIPVIIFVLVLFISFIGANYGFDAPSMYTSLGDSYGVGAILNTFSWGVIVTLGGFVLLAAKGSEI